MKLTLVFLLAIAAALRANDAVPAAALAADIAEAVADVAIKADDQAVAQVGDDAQAQEEFLSLARQMIDAKDDQKDEMPEENSFESLFEDMKQDELDEARLEKLFDDVPVDEVAVDAPAVQADAPQEAVQQQSEEVAQDALVSEPEERSVEANDPLFEDLLVEEFGDAALPLDDGFSMDDLPFLDDAMFDERALPLDKFELEGNGGDGLNNWGGVYNTTVTLVPGDGWVEFLFNGTNTTVTSNFLAYDASNELVLYLTDIGCSGDQFEIYDNGVLLGDSSVPTVNNCSVVLSDPSVAYAAPGYSTFSSTLAAGVTHNITLVMLASPYGGGTGALQVNLNLETCTIPSSNITVIVDPMPFNETRAACDGLGMRAIDMTIYNFDEATQVLFECLGAYSHAYVGAYWANTYMGSPLALWTSFVTPGAAIAPTLSGEIPLPVICEPRTYFTTYDEV